MDTAATVALRAGDQDYDGNVQVVLPGGLQVPCGRGGSTAVAHVEPKHAQREPVVVAQCLRHALIRHVTLRLCWSSRMFSRLSAARNRQPLDNESIVDSTLECLCNSH